MKFLLVAHSATTVSVKLWLCATEIAERPPATAVRIEKVRDIPVDEGNWEPVTVDRILSIEDSKTWVQVVEVTGLSPGKRHIATFGDARATFSTLPDQLPNAGSPPFNVLVASCFFVNEDQGVGPTALNWAEADRPDIKFMTGDQVYLDFPNYFFIGMPFRERSLAKAMLAKYLRNWSVSGYRSVLEQGSTWFISDDHEYWNNYPNAATLITQSWTEGGRKRMTRVGLSLYQSFQCTSPALAGQMEQFNVGRLSFFVADTRVFRGPGKGRLLLDEDLAKLKNWAASLTGPGVLVLSQLIIDEPASNFSGTLGDWSLPNYPQYSEMLAAIEDAPHTIVVVTGDVHYPRVATAGKGDGRLQLMEVIASPAALVGPPVIAKFSRSNSKAPPGKLGLLKVTQHQPVQGGDNFALLQFSEASGRVFVKVRHSYVKGGWTNGETFALD